MAGRQIPAARVIKQEFASRPRPQLRGIVHRTGIKERHRLANETNCAMSAIAARTARNPAVGRGRLESFRRTPIPMSASGDRRRLQAELGAPRAAALLSCGRSSGCTVLSLKGSCPTGAPMTVLVGGTEKLSRPDGTDRSTAVRSGRAGAVFSSVKHHKGISHVIPQRRQSRRCCCAQLERRDRSLPVCKGRRTQSRGRGEVSARGALDSDARGSRFAAQSHRREIALFVPHQATPDLEATASTGIPMRRYS